MTKFKKLKIAAIVFSVLIFTTNLFGTADRLVVNHITNELYWASCDKKPGFIGWENIPEGEWFTAEEKYIELGYTITTFPFLIELFLSITIILLSIITFLILRRMNQ